MDPAPPAPRRSILIAEDDDDDFLLAQMALSAAGFDGAVFRVRDGAELMDFLLSPSGPRALAGPRLLLLLDLNMPRKDGRVALAEIKAHPSLRKLPVVVLTTSNAETDIESSYALGANSFIMKPAGFDEFVELLRVVKRYWFEAVSLPNGEAACPP